MHDQIILTIGIPTLAVLAGILVNNSRLSDMNSRLNSMENSLLRVIEVRSDAHDQALRRVEEVLDARLRHIEERLNIR